MIHVGVDGDLEAIGLTIDRSITTDEVETEHLEVRDGSHVLDVSSLDSEVLGAWGADKVTVSWHAVLVDKLVEESVLRSLIVPGKSPLEAGRGHV